MIPLFVPGPITVHPAVLTAQAATPIYHRGEEYGRMLRDITAMLAQILGTASDVYCVCGSGTATLEMAVQNICRSGDRVVVATNGYFGERLAELCHRLDLDTAHVRADYTEPLPIKQIDRALRTPTTALLAVHHETSTGRVNDLATLADLCRARRTLCVVDAVSSAGVLPVNMDHHGLDVVVTSSHKGIGGTPGVGILAISPGAWERARTVAPPATLAGDWGRVRRAFLRDPAESLWTPPISVMAGLHAALEMLTRRAPLAQAQARRAAIGRAVRAGLSACGFTVWPTGAVEVAPVTAAEPPLGIAADELVATVREVSGVQIGSGLGPLAGRIVRVSHLGIELFHVFGLLGAISVAARGAANGAGEGPAEHAWRAFTASAVEVAAA
jgi:aspartate aminotransferase-like enzyme